MRGKVRRGMQHRPSTSSICQPFSLPCVY